jgi:hypothetical protein
MPFKDNFPGVISAKTLFNHNLFDNNLGAMPKFHAFHSIMISI